MKMAELTRNQIRLMAKKKALVIIPIGAFEPHGDHLPLNTDNLIVEGIAEKTEAELEAKKMPVIVTPTVWLSWTGMPSEEGALKIPLETFQDIIFQICQSLLLAGFEKIVLLNAHGPNHTNLIPLIETKIWPQHYGKICLVSWFVIASDELSKLRAEKLGDSWHSGEMETSLVMHLAPDLVRKENIRKGSVTRPGEWYGNDIVTMIGKTKVFGFPLNRYRPEDDTGVDGDPTSSSEILGREYLNIIVSKVCKFLEEWLKTKTNTRRS